MLLNDSNWKAKRTLKQIITEKKLEKMDVFGSYAVFYKEKIFVDWSITEVVRLIDARQRKIDCAESQLGKD